MRLQRVDNGNFFNEVYITARNVNTDVNIVKYKIFGDSIIILTDATRTKIYVKATQWNRFILTNIIGAENMEVKESSVDESTLTTI